MKSTVHVQCSSHMFKFTLHSIDLADSQHRLILSKNVCDDIYVVAGDIYRYTCIANFHHMRFPCIDFIFNPIAMLSCVVY